MSAFPPLEVNGHQSACRLTSTRPNLRAFKLGEMTRNSYLAKIQADSFGTKSIPDLRMRYFGWSLSMRNVPGMM